MPRVKKPKSLSKICADFIANNMDKFYVESTMGKFDQINAIDPKESTNLFEQLPSIVLEDIIKMLSKREDPLEEKFFKLLITPHLCTLDLSLTENISDIHQLLQLATIQSPNLKTLLFCHDEFSEVSFSSFIPKFSKLHVLDISHTTAKDNCLNLLGSHCPDLRKLNAEYCHVTNDGIEGLCVRGQCKLITVLHLRETNVTNEGIQMVLNNLPDLKELDHSVVEVLAQISQTALDNKLVIAPKFSLAVLKIMFNTPYRSGSLGAAVSICPSVTKVVIRNDVGNVTDEDLQGLLALERLEDLHIRGHDDTSLTFLGGIVPLLKNRGSSLKKLELSQIEIVDIATIVKYCLTLRYLALSRIDIFDIDNICPEETEISPQPKRIKMVLPILNNLEILYLSESFEIPAEHLFLLLSSPALKVIEILKCDTLTDDLLQRAASLHLFQNLAKLIISDCYLVTEKIMNVLMQESNPIKNIHMTWFECNFATNYEEIVEEWEKVKIRKNWDLEIFLKNWGYVEEEELNERDFPR